MSNLFTLQSIREEADRSFRPVVITLADGSECTLSNLLRLPKKQRLEVTRLLKKLEHLEGNDPDDLESDDVDVFLETASQILCVVGDKGKKLVAEIDSDLTVTMKVMEKWMDSTQSGEASGSES
jgi:hypothetical protein